MNMCEKTIHKPVFICGTGRSGTTLLAMMLDKHSNFVSGPEIKILQPISQLYNDFRMTFSNGLNEYNIDQKILNDSFRDFISGFFLQRGINERIVEHTPLNILSIGPLSQIFPDSTFLHMIRDGRDVVCSLTEQNWVDPKTNKPLWFVESKQNGAKYWMQIILSARQAVEKHQIYDRYLEIRYEDLIEDPETVLREIVWFLGESYEDSLMKYYKEQSFSNNEHGPERKIYKSSLQRWQSEFNDRDKQIVNAIAGDLLIDLGYEDDNSWSISQTVPLEK